MSSRRPAALVTGGGRGIGRTIARTLTAAGWTVAVTGRSPGPLHEAVAAGDAALAVPGDATDRAAVEDGVRRAEQQLGPLDLVVANAGRFEAAGPLWETDPDEWWRDVEVNVRGPLLLLRAVLPGMVERRAGRVVVLGSGMGTAPLPYASGYATSKAAVMRLVDSVAAELADTGVSVFVISPGLVATDMTRFPEPYLQRYPDWRGKAQREGVPPERAAQLVLTLASGRYDALSGRFLRTTTDLAQAAAAAAQEEPGTLRLAPYGPA
jgi:NAD(P)-dependent dehydrogenase (short-subunit alcohol dehydrogenase family)